LNFEKLIKSISKPMPGSILLFIVRKGHQGHIVD
jgi:hypothetical protein